MVTIFVEGREHEVEEGPNLLQTVLGLGYDLPYFCWHPALGSVGACRQCAVKQFRDADDTTGMIVMACMTPVSDGLRISIDDTEARDFRASVIEWYMTNHPHDCPICDEGGECHLQDMTVMSGHNVREYRFNKRTYRNQDLGPFIGHEMNRCIQCYRCVRFYRDYAGGDDLNVFGTRNRIYFGRVSDGVLESSFSGNLVEVCPTGVFTDKNAEARSVRPWDLQTAPSVCVLCGLGCNTLPGERNGTLRRVRNRYHGEINRYFLCDRGRFGFEFVNSPRRIRHPIIRVDGETSTVTAAQAIDHVASFTGGDEVVGIGSPRASLEANFALRRLVGAENFYLGIGADEAACLRTVVEILRAPPVPTPTLREVEQADAVLILGEDPSNTAALLDLAVRQAVLNAPKEDARDLGIPVWNDFFNRLIVNHRHGPLFIATPAPTGLDEFATDILRAPPWDIARFGFAIAAVLDPETALPPDLPAEVATAAQTIAGALKNAKQPLVIAGMGCGSPATIRAAAEVARVLRPSAPATGLSLVVPDCNSVGAGLLEAPDLGAAATRDRVDTAIVLEPDLSTRERRTGLTAILDNTSHVVVLDHLESAVADAAEVVLPAATFAECNGTVVNNETRAQRFYQVFVPADGIRASWRWLQQISTGADGDDAAAWNGPDDLAKTMADELPIFGPLIELASSPGGSPPRRVPRQTHRVTGRTAVNAHLEIREAKPPDDHETPMSYSMEGSPHHPPAPLINRYWSPGWNSVQGLTRFQEEIGGSLRGGDPGVRLAGSPADDICAPFDRGLDALSPREDELLLVPIHHLFGSEPLSLEAPGIAERAPQPYLALNPDTAGRLDAVVDEPVVIEIAGRRHELPIKVVEGLPDGCAGLPEGLPGLSGLPAGRLAKVRKPS